MRNCPQRLSMAYQWHNMELVLIEAFSSKESPSASLCIAFVLMALLLSSVFFSSHSFFLHYLSLIEPALAVLAQSVKAPDLGPSKNCKRANMSSFPGRGIGVRKKSYPAISGWVRRNTDADISSWIGLVAKKVVVVLDYFVLASLFAVGKVSRAMFGLFLICQ